MATTAVKVYTLSTCDKFVAAFPSLGLTCYVDDWKVSAEGPEAEVAITVGDGVKHLTEAVATDLDCDFAPAKDGVIATSQGLITRLRRHCPGLGGRGATVVKDLGIDSRSGAARRFLSKESQKAKRLRCL